MKYIPFTYKIMFPYLLLILLTNLLIGYYSYHELIRSRTEATRGSVTSALQQSGDQIRYHMDMIRHIGNSLYSNRTLGTALQTEGDAADMYRLALDHIIPAMQTPFDLLGNNARIIVYAENDQLLEVLGDDLDTPIQQKHLYLLHTSRIAGEDWFVRLRQAGEDGSWRQVGNDALLGHMSYMRKLVSFKDYVSISGYLRVVMTMEDLFGSLRALPLGESAYAHVVDRDGRTLYASGDSEVRGKQDVLRLDERIDDTGLAIEVFIPESYLRKDAEQIRRLITLVCSVSFIAMTLLGIAIARLAGRKMRKTVAMINSIEEGHFYKRLRLPGNDEFVLISRAINRMADNIEHLMQDVYEQGMQKKRAELEALQAQINPHFLYNTLSSINSLSKLGNTEQISTMVTRLVTFYRLGLNDGKSMIRLSDELEHVNSYIDIQRVKYADRFSVEYEVDPSILPFETVKLILQPFVENALHHGWHGERISLRITGRNESGVLSVTIEDDGAGIDPERLALLTDPTIQRQGYGIRNVDERIKLRYGAAYGVTIESVLGEGTKITIRWPVTAAETEREDDDHAKCAAGR